ncbi:MAG: bifunctional folylpolyglutamate synthase/dihydrofolate synthase [Belnapia sp.]|nr:bifunctional folylpolyglutamate synthase/dihydrofolate synthase [Belnapia sp.]
MSRSEAILDRLHALHPVLIDLSLERLQDLLAKLGHPERRLPPVVHVAGTNGKGSTCAFLRAIAEAAGQRVHAFTSPHLVRFHERIRLAGTLVEEAALAVALEEVEAVNAGAPITVFEVITAVALLLFSRVPADLLVLEVGLGGRFDATNVVAAPVATAITSISMDHMEFLGDRLEGIAFEKAGIIKPGVPCATGAQAPEALAVIARCAAEAAAPLLARDAGWTIAPRPSGLSSGLRSGLRYADARGGLDLPPPGLLGAHQADNAGIAIAALRGWNPGWLTDAAIAAGVAAARWPGRLQQLHGRLAGALPADWELWLDGGHNAGGGAALAVQAAAWRDRPLHLVVGMKGTKVVADFLRPLLPFATTLWAVAEPGQHLATPVARIIAASGGLARPGPTVAEALAALPRHGGPARVLVCGSLYLAGEVLKLDAVG